METPAETPAETSNDKTIIMKSVDFAKHQSDWTRDGWRSGFVIGALVMLIIVLIGCAIYYRRQEPQSLQEHNSNRDPLAEQIMFAKQTSDPLDAAMLLDDVENFHDPYDSKFEHLSDSNVYEEPEESRTDNNELIDLLYA